MTGDATAKADAEAPYRAEFDRLMQTRFNDLRMGSVTLSDLYRMFWAGVNFENRRWVHPPKTAKRGQP